MAVVPEQVFPRPRRVLALQRDCISSTQQHRKTCKRTKPTAVVTRNTFHLGSMVEATTKPTILSEKSFLKPTNYPQTPHGGRDEHQLLFSKAGVLSSFASSSIIRQQGVKASLGPANVEQDFQTKRACVLPSFRDIDNSHAKDGPSASLSCKPQS